jgi:hypothetical protein
MDFKYFILLFFILLYFNISNAQTLNSDCIKNDSININCYCCDRGLFYIIGKRLYPDPCLNDKDAFELAEMTHIFLIIEKSDTLYILSDREIFNTCGVPSRCYNPYIPPINDSLIESFYKKKYKIVKDPDPPYWTGIENEKDTIVVELKSQGYKKNRYLFGTIRDTIFQFSDGIKIGIDKNEFFKILGIDFSYDKNNFTVLLTSIFESNVSWYFKYYCAKYTNDIYCYPDGFHVIIFFKYFFIFKDNKLVKIEFFL